MSLCYFVDLIHNGIIIVMNEKKLYLCRFSYNFNCINITVVQNSNETICMSFSYFVDSGTVMYNLESVKTKGTING